jgi:hypothetical protein
MFRLQILWLQAGSFCDSSQHVGADFLVVVKGEDEVRPAIAG